MVERIELSAHKLAEHEVCSWLDGTTAPPRRLTEAVGRYLALAELNRLAPTKEATLAIDKKMDAIFDHLLATVIGERAVVAKQLRRIERRAEARMTLSERWRIAITDPARAIAWPTGEWVAYQKAVGRA
ncbi:MAG: hypothetical protein KGL39_55620 [Patescibacteria group bacterium]|nr:hypothetical protein [Patescibacteria group bacterium]